jgi:hypothetical protein
MKSAETIIRLRRKYTALRTAETLLFAASGALLTWALLFGFTGQQTISLLLAAASGAATFILRARHLALFSVSDERIAYFLNRSFAELKDSTDLLVQRPDELSSLEQIQARRTADTLSKLRAIKLPNHFFIAAFAALLSTIAVIGASNLLTTGGNLAPAERNEPATALPTELAPATIQSHMLTIHPPGYTGLKAARTETLSTVAAEGSLASWSVAFSGDISRAVLRFSDADSIALRRSDADYIGTKRITESHIYRLEWTDQSGTHSSNYFELTMKPDQPPVVHIRDLGQFTRLKWGDKKGIEIPVTISDDFGLTQGYIVATVSKGSGESVKFREEKLPFQPPAIKGKNVKAHRILDFKALGMDPGDEVYFYAEAWDNKNPGSQRSRTETFFVSLQDTASNIVTVDASLGVDLMPDYFRSQRQIIIDTEKLLKDKPRITKQEFNRTSNELGYDQKVLRLKYGQFLGEEFETNIGAPAHEEEADEEESDPAKKYGHQHDKDNEHNLVSGKKTEAGHDNEEEEDDDPMAAFKHNHDNMEEATFFTQSVRTKLKAALTLMWEAELQLRLFAPKESLPVQYKILNLLKEISQDSRIYVHRMGFDPPPLKEEKRLTGDLDEIGNPVSAGVAATEQAFPAIKQVLPGIQTALDSKFPLASVKFRNDLEAAAREIAQASLEQPGSYLTQLSQIRIIVDGKMKADEMRLALRDIQEACWKILPGAEPGPQPERGTMHGLDARLLEELKRPVND